MTPTARTLPSTTIYATTMSAKRTAAFVNERYELFKASGLADPDFEKRFSLECGSRIWEIYLATALASWGWTLVPPKKPGHGPDFGVMLEGTKVWFEATAPTAGNDLVNGVPNRDRVHAPRNKIIGGRELDRTIALRYLGGISEKRQKHQRWLADGVVAAGDGFVIALSGAMVPEAIFEPHAKPPRVVAALFGVGELVAVVPTDGSDIAYGFAERPEIPKTSGATVPAALFADASAPEVSAVLFSPSYLKERPERRGRPPGFDFVFVLNPHAAVQFPAAAPRGGRLFDQGRMVDCGDR